ncbi:MAG: M48 family metalloprotease, partial [Candidatus Puniceispirillaceae bacterium]
MLQHVRIADARDHIGNDVLNRLAFHLQTAHLRTSNGQTAGHGQTAGSSKQIRLALLRMVLGALGLLVGLATTLPAQANMIRDTEIEAGVDELIAPLINVAGFAPEAIDVRIILDNRVNAFVQSKRTIYVHSGLIESAEDPLLFLGVMAHELAHLKAGHVQQIDEALGQALLELTLLTLCLHGSR